MGMESFGKKSSEEIEKEKDKKTETMLSTQTWARMLAVLEKEGITETRGMSWDQIEDKYREITKDTGPYTRWHSKSKLENI